MFGCVLGRFTAEWPGPRGPLLPSPPQTSPGTGRLLFPLSACCHPPLLPFSQCFVEASYLLVILLINFTFIYRLFFSCNATGVPEGRGDKKCGLDLPSQPK